MCVLNSCVVMVKIDSFCFVQLSVQPAIAQLTTQLTIRPWQKGLQQTAVKSVVIVIVLLVF